MKQLVKTTLLLLALLLPTLATAHDFEVDGIYYNINGSEAAVTFKGRYYNEYYDEYSGSVVIPASVTYNGTTYPVTSIGSRTFGDCTGLTSVIIPNSVTAIGDYAFSCCRGVTSIDIPNSITSIGACAFYECSGLTSIAIPNSVTAIGQSAFLDCTGLTSIVIPNSVTSIGSGAFYGCRMLTDVYSFIADLSSVSSRNHLFYLDNGDYSGRTLHVLQGTADAYRADVRWSWYFGQIVDDLKPDVPGDVPGDSVVNIADINAIIDIILGGSGNPAVADVNGDKTVNIADINAIIDIILNRTHN